MGLLAGTIRQPLVLVYHFFSVAMLAIWIVLSESPLYKLPLALISGLGIFYKAVVVFSPLIVSELRS